MKPLPVLRYEYAEWLRAKVNVDYHVELDGHDYSAPHALVANVMAHSPPAWWNAASRAGAGARTSAPTHAANTPLLPNTCRSRTADTSSGPPGGG